MCQNFHFALMYRHFRLFLLNLNYLKFQYYRLNQMFRLCLNYRLYPMYQNYHRRLVDLVIPLPHRGQSFRLYQTFLCFRKNQKYLCYQNFRLFLLFLLYQNYRQSS
jgi:hypothetical protein